MARPPKDKTSFKIPADTTLFSEEELKKLEAEALEEFEKETKEEAAATFKEQLKD